MFDYLIDMPVKVACGPGKLGDLGKISAQYGSKAFFLYDPYLRDTATLEEIRKDLKRSGVGVVEFDDVEPNPRDSTIDRAAALCTGQGCDLVISMGGGSAIDSAKAVAIVAKNGGKTWEYTRSASGNKLPEKGKLPMIAIPTTSGTGTETTPFAVINNPRLHCKATIVEDACYAAVAIVDPQVMASMPPRLTALTGIDAFAHALEAYVSSLATPYVEAVCLEAIRLFLGNIEECCKNGNNLAARGNMALASTLGGIAIGHACTTMPHAIAQAFGGITDAPHGAAIATCTRAVIEWTLPGGQEKFARVARMMDSSLEGLGTEQQAAKLPGLVDDFFARILDGKRVTMSGCGLKEAQIPDVVDLIMDRYYGDCELQPRVPSKEDLLQVVRRSF